MNEIAFDDPPPPQYGGGCTTEPALFALNHFATWRTDVTVNGQVYREVELMPFLQAVQTDPAHYGVTRQTVQEAVDRFIAATAPLLEREGGEQDWLEREFAGRTAL